MRKLLLLLFLSVPLIAFANVIWPSIYILSQVYCWYVIVAGLVVEFFAVKFFWKSLLGKVGRYYSCHECRFSIGWVGFDSCQWYPYGISVVPL